MPVKTLTGEDLCRNYEALQVEVRQFIGASEASIYHWSCTRQYATSDEGVKSTYKARKEGYGSEVDDDDR